MFRAGEGEPVKARTFDLSADDLRMITRERLEVGTRLRLRIDGNAAASSWRRPRRWSTSRTTARATVAC